MTWIAIDILIHEYLSTLINKLHKRLILYYINILKTKTIDGFIVPSNVQLKVGLEWRKYKRNNNFTIKYVHIQMNLPFYGDSTLDYTERVLGK